MAQVILAQVILAQVILAQVILAQSIWAQVFDILDASTSHFPFLQKEKFNLTFCTISGNKPYLVMDDIHDRKISFKYQ